MWFQLRHLINMFYLKFSELLFRLHIESQINNQIKDLKVIVTKRKQICAVLRFKRGTRGATATRFGLFGPRLFALGITYFATTFQDE